MARGPNLVQHGIIKHNLSACARGFYFGQQLPLYASDFLFTDIVYVIYGRQTYIGEMLSYRIPRQRMFSAPCVTYCKGEAAGAGIVIHEC